MKWIEFQKFVRGLGYREFYSIGSLWREYKDMKEGIFELSGDIENTQRSIKFHYEFLQSGDMENDLPKDELPNPTPEAIREDIWKARKKTWKNIKNNHEPRDNFDNFFRYNSNDKFKIEKGKLICLDT